ncbi:hypothetical protein E4T56_gene3577 [Termitomyces sp. T112]|nr:hypothetical protein E4T56_gene3577 [Termitomyces sp. T112]
MGALPAPAPFLPTPLPPTPSESGFANDIPPLTLPPNASRSFAIALAVFVPETEFERAVPWPDTLADRVQLLLPRARHGACEWVGEIRRSRPRTWVRWAHAWSVRSMPVPVAVAVAMLTLAHGIRSAYARRTRTRTRTYS